MQTYKDSTISETNFKSIQTSEKYSRPKDGKEESGYNTLRIPKTNNCVSNERNTETLGKPFIPSTASSKSATTIATTPITCNNYIHKSNARFTQTIKTTCSHHFAAYSSVEKTCDRGTCLNDFYQRKNNFAVNSFRRTTISGLKSFSNSSKRFRNQMLPLNSCYPIKDFLFNYLFVIFIVCQLLNLGVIKCVSCFEASYSAYSHLRSSKYQLPPYAPPPAYFRNSRKFSSQTLPQEATFQDKSGIHHFSGPNTLPLYRPHYDNISHFSEGKQCRFQSSIKIRH